MGIMTKSMRVQRSPEGSLQKSCLRVYIFYVYRILSWKRKYKQTFATACPFVVDKLFATACSFVVDKLFATACLFVVDKLFATACSFVVDKLFATNSSISTNEYSRQYLHNLLFLGSDSVLRILLSDCFFTKSKKYSTG